MQQKIKAAGGGAENYNFYQGATSPGDLGNTT